MIKVLYDKTFTYRSRENFHDFVKVSSRDTGPIVLSELLAGKTCVFFSKSAKSGSINLC